MTRVTCTLVTILLIHVTHVSNDPARHVTSDTESEYLIINPPAHHQNVVIIIMFVCV